MSNASNDCDLEATAPRSHVSAILVRVLADVVQQRGSSPEVFLGEDAASIYAEPAERWFELDWFLSLLGRAIRLTGDPALGLHCALHANESSFGLMSPLVSHALTLRHAIALASQFQPLFSDGVRLQFVQRADVAQLSCAFDCGAAGERGFVELIVAGLARMLRAFGCRRSDIHAVCFPHARPQYYRAYSAAFAGAERFSQSFSGILFSADALDRRHLHGSRELHQLMLAQAERSLERLWRPLSCTERVRALLANRPAPALPDMVSAARELGLSVRSLRRRLEEERTSYRELSQSALHAYACSLLRNPGLTLQHVAHELGFSDPTAFHRAFRRWQNLTPAEYRATCRPEPARQVSCSAVCRGEELSI